ncbi:T9SS type A sorting domain-containing protein [Emticicia sp. BO119]|uniref:T9SS type A sorting domain-containing protein n=1 Tax=Emticicia sp. BO119 TaxID=2757768 RepID=UPI0015F014A6|nr:T9SS type A sorting domain-containing protein [Emticicia sp. BO119]MBA4852909.1 T9SS type A sorting domain-containing protein [Emticicia sp. BO119]
MFFKTLEVAKRKHILTLCVFLFSINTFAQISLSLPTNRIVFQRNNDNIGFITIIGNYSQPIDKIQARLIPVADSWGVPMDWTTIQENPKGGYFSGRMAGFGGWYTMEIRALKDNNVLQTITVERVGIGEVFVALGQSNAEGLPGSGALGAADDRVNVINFRNTQDLDPLPENLNFVHLDAETNIAPIGSSAWCYGELGDKLAQKLNVPVLFFNAGLLGVSVINWRESAEGKPTINIFDQTLPNGLPYSNLRNTLHYYGALLGVRSLLWIQGETDNYPYQLSADVYASNLTRLIDIVRAQFSGDLSWMVARTSITYQHPSNPEIIGGQNRVIERPGYNVFPGPYTDDLQPNRPDFVHFKNAGPGNMGLSILADAWNTYLDDNFFRNSKPVMARAAVDIQLTCNADNQAILTLPDNLTNYSWSNGGNTNQIIVDKGIYSAKVRDPQGNQLVVPTVNTNFIYPVTRPQITYEGDLEFCANIKSNINLKANGIEFSNFQWSTGVNATEITVANSGQFSVKGLNEFSCASASSDNTDVKINPAPVKPQIAVSPDASVCEGVSIQLHVNSDDTLLWSDSTTSKDILLDSVGVYNFRVKATNAFGCAELSDSIGVRINPLPAKPHIAISPDTVVCKGTVIKLRTDTNENIQWSNNSTAKEISIDSVGDYSFKVKAITSFGCIQESDAQTAHIKETPKTPDLDKSGIYTLQALNVTLGASDQFQWIRENSRLITSVIPSLKVQQAGAYQVSVVRTYQLGSRTLTCESLPSKSLFLRLAADDITLYPNPAQDIIYLETKENLKNVMLEFYTYAGKFAYRFYVTDTTERKGLDLRKVENGSYIVRIKGADFEKTERIIITQ